MKISGLRDCSVFLDTNILMYAFTETRFTPACEELLEKVRNDVVKGHVNSTVIDEFFHNVLLMQIQAEKGMPPTGTGTTASSLRSCSSCPRSSARSSSGAPAIASA